MTSKAGPATVAVARPCETLAMESTAYLVDEIGGALRVGMIARYSVLFSLALCVMAGSALLVVKLGPPSSHEAVAAARLEASGHQLAECWDVESVTGDAATARVVVLFEVTRVHEYVLSGSFGNTYTDYSAPVLGSISGSSASAAADASEAARRAIIRCGKDGFLLPIENYLPRNVAEATFGPQEVRVR